MTSPEAYGMSPVETLAHVADPATAPGFAPFWTRWAEEVWSTEPALEQGPPSPADGDAGATHTIVSLGAVRIGARLVPPANGAPAEGAVLSLHGYRADDPISSDSPFAQRPITVLRLRIRGYPGSQADSGDLAARPGGWITEALDSRGGWVMRGAVADVVNAFRALRDFVGPETPISICGESFGAGLAILGAAQLCGRACVARMAIGLPTFGDWQWRLMRAHQSGAGEGSGAEVARFLLDHAPLASQIADTLRTFDAAVHARRISCPVLCKLAMLDDVVPAPSAAAVYNALGSSPESKWRFIVERGHADGGVADLRRHAAFERLAVDFLDPSLHPADVMRAAVATTAARESVRPGNQDVPVRPAPPVDARRLRS